MTVRKIFEVSPHVARVTRFLHRLGFRGFYILSPALGTASPWECFPTTTGSDRTSRREKDTFPNLWRYAVELYFSKKKSPQGMQAHPRSARMGEMGQHARMPAWDGGRGTCVKPFDCLPNMTPRLNATGGGQGTVLIRAPLSAQRKELEPKRRWRGGEERVWGKWRVKRPARVSRGCHSTESDLWLVLTTDLEFGFQAAN